VKFLLLNWRDVKHPDAGGAELYVQNLCSEFVRLGHEVDLYSSSFPNAKTEEEVDGVKITRCGGRFSVYWSVYRHYLKHGSKYDVVLESINTIPFFARFYARHPVVPLIYSINNGRALLKELGITPISLLGWLCNSLIPKIYSQSTVITISETSKKELVTAGFDVNNVFVAWPSVSFDFEKFVKITPETKRPNCRIVYLGRLKKYKGIDILLQAFAILRQSMPFELLIVGKGNYKDQLLRKVVELGLNDCVHFTGFVSEETKVLLLKNSSVFVCCSIDEGGWTIAGLEAMKCGVPVVVTDSQRDLVQEGVTGFITPPQPEIVADKIRAVFDGDWKSLSVESLRLSASITYQNSAMVALRALKSAMNKYHLNRSALHGD
jgi:glycosyltransferase involved in cell wall biosynthesis